MNYSLSKKKAKELVEAKLSHFMGVSPEEATDEQYYKAIALIVRDMMSQGRTEFSEKAAKAGTKKVYYLCMEFLMGRSLKNNLYNLNLTDVFASVLADYGVKLENLYECEPDAGLGNGGLGRLAACYLSHFLFLYFQHPKSCQNFQIHVLYIVSELDTDVLTFHVYNDALTEFLMLYNHAFTKCIRKFLIAFSRLLLKSMPGAISMIHSISLYAICSRRTIISPFFYSCIFFLLILSQIPLSQQLTAEFGRLIRRKYIQLILCSGHTYIEESSFFLISFKFFL